jgi:hypothetical protein
MPTKPKVQVEAGELAQLLYDALIVKRAVNMPNQLKIPDALENKMRSKTTLYQYASVSLAVAVEQQTDFAFRFVDQQLALCRLAPQKSELLSATKDFERILGIDAKVGYIGWAREWLLDIGIDETNPAVLGMLQDPTPFAGRRSVDRFPRATE